MKFVFALLLILTIGGPNNNSLASSEKVKNGEKVNMFNGNAVMWISVSDLKESKDWYEKVLEVNFFMQPRPNQWIGAGPVKDMGIGLTEVASPYVSEISPLSIGTDDLEKVVAFLKSLGEKPSEDIVVIPGVVKVAVFKDPDGHKITFSQLLHTQE